MGNRTKRRARRAEQVPAARAERKERRRRLAENRRHLAVLLSTTLELTDELAEQLELEGWPRARLVELGNAGRRYSPERDSFFGPVCGHQHLSRVEYTRDGAFYHEALADDFSGRSRTLSRGEPWSCHCGLCKDNRKELIA